MKQEDVENFSKVNGQIEALYSEITALSKKTPNDAVNKFKLSLINRILQDANALLTDAYRPFDSFDSFSEDELPSNSDVALILSQYLNCLESFRADNIAESQDDIYWYWVIDGELSDVRTPKPKRLKEK